MALETRSGKNKGNDSEPKQVDMSAASSLSPQEPLTWEPRTPEPVRKINPYRSRAPERFDPSKVEHTPSTPWDQTFSWYIAPDGSFFSNAQVAREEHLAYPIDNSSDPYNRVFPRVPTKPILSPAEREAQKARSQEDNAQFNEILRKEDEMYEEYRREAQLRKKLKAENAASNEQSSIIVRSKGRKPLCTTTGRVPARPNPMEEESIERFWCPIEGCPWSEGYTGPKRKIPFFRKEQVDYHLRVAEHMLNGRVVESTSGA